MAIHRTLVQLPPEIIALKLRRQREALRAAAGSWKAEDHPELDNGASAYVRQLRDLGNERIDRIQAHRDAHVGVGTSPKKAL